MLGTSTIHQVTYTLSIRSIHHQLGPPVFHGTLETVAGQKFEFSTLAELNRLLCEVGGWIDTPTLVNEGGEANASCQAIDPKSCDDESDESDFSPDRGFKKEEQ